MFGRIVHCDWSVRPKGRWLAEARRDGGGGWQASGPRPVGDLAAFVDELFALEDRSATLAAFDVPIGLPVAYGGRTGFSDFPAALRAFGRGAWAEVYVTAATPAEIGLRRPFYPAQSGGARLRHLLDGHGVTDSAALTRACERGGPRVSEARPACSGRSARTRSARPRPTLGRP